MFLIFCLGRLDVLPVTDLGIRKAMQKTYSLSDLPKPTEMLSLAQPWKPYRSYVVSVEITFKIPFDRLDAAVNQRTLRVTHPFFI